VAVVPQTTAAASVRVLQAAANRMTVSGALTFETARRAHELGLRVLRSGSTDALQIDCGGVTESDSAGLAVLIDWLATANRLGRPLTFANIPAGIRAAARISDVDSFLS
jgi:phospholipid transport system transporter-binding protein